MERRQLVAARMRKCWTQEMAAGFAGVSVRAWRAWERGTITPRLSSIEQLCQLFATSAQELGFAVTAQPEHSDPVPHPLVFGDLTMQLLAVAFVPQRGFEAVQMQITAILEEYDAMSEKSINRREALARLASVPFIASLRPGLTLPRAEEVIMQCAASIAACWELSKSTHEEDLHRAFDTATTFLVPLQRIAQESHYQKDATALLGQCALLRTVLGWHLQSVKEAAGYAREAIAYAKEAGDLVLQVSAMDYLCWALYYDQRTKQAEQTAAQATRLVEQHKQLLPPLLCSGVYATSSVMQAKNGGKAAAAFDQAGRYFVADNPETSLKYIYMDYTKSALVLNDGMIHYFAGEQSQAMHAFQQLIDPQKLTARLPVPGRTQVETLNFMAMSTLKRKDRDMEEALHYWTAAMRGAVALQSEQRHQEARLTYQIMDVVWGGERRVKEVQELTAHW